MFVNMKKKIIFIALLSLFLLSTLSLSAQKRKAIVIEEIKIEGTIQKPEVMTFLSRARFSYKSLDLNISFLEKVEKAIHTNEAF